MVQNTLTRVTPSVVPMPVSRPLWELGITELMGRNLETSGRQEVERTVARRLDITARIHPQIPRR
jgi:hypothetical protein